MNKLDTRHPERSAEQEEQIHRLEQMLDEGLEALSGGRTISRDEMRRKIGAISELIDALAVTESGAQSARCRLRFQPKHMDLIPVADGNPRGVGAQGNRAQPQTPAIVDFADHAE